jgi:serine/threonine protein kinase
VIHGDIKAANILTDRNANIKLSDFGASKLIEGIPADLDVSQSGRLFEHNKGSLYWMAPEILYGEPYGRRSDIWALGCTILEIASGKHPWASDAVVDLDDLKQKMLEQQLPQIPTQLSASAKDFIT